MSRLLLLIAIAAVGYYLYRSLRRPKAPPPRQVHAEDAVRCEYCGVHLPASEAIRVGTHPYCSEAHRKLAGAAQQRDDAD
ncbi:PP0621 family protein [Acidihalobacter ferrooxydans]|uniref:Preprotein translocase subunit YajC n=1 Tax=Acidihalobacter ferrooxydans TaxID=1765967 RepID=A0A1P8UJD8_9GAMM|nr:PP0621 family protein [Acidihalobacter ferrooxydans]APZ43955.1 hypothetical protein BW247_13345 [Acidihalobacter ferrooxydans]